MIPATAKRQPKLDVERGAEETPKLTHEREHWRRFEMKWKGRRQENAQLVLHLLQQHALPNVKP